VTVAFTLRGLFPASLAPAYVLAQLAGALGAAGLVAVLLGSAVSAGVTMPHGIEPGVAVAIEILLTGILVTVIIGTADRYRVVGPNAAMAVGATIALCGLIALPLEGASMNPARSTGPAVVAADVGSLWIYWVGPLVGAVLAVVVARLLHGPERGDEQAVEAATGGEGRRTATN
jgi:aquaporin Z